MINMQKDMKFKIITEGLKNGISVTCRKYNISRTIFYRWLHRYKTYGINGLDEIKKDFIPKNKTSPEIEEKIFQLIKTYPSYGPKAIKYLSEEIGCHISESAIYNIMKRYNLTNKANRIKFAKKSKTTKSTLLPPFSELESGECWIFWINDYGTFHHLGKIYEYTIIDAKSKIACTRLYNSLSFHHFEDLLTAVAIPIAQTLNFKTNHLCFLQDSKMVKEAKQIFNSTSSTTIIDSFLDLNIHILDSYDDIEAIYSLKKEYTERCISSLLPKIQKDLTFKELKLHLQHYIRKYNIQQQLMFNDKLFSPVEFHIHSTNSKLILPLWAYIDREY